MDGRANPAADVTGVYALYREGDELGTVIGHLRIPAQRGCQFLVGIAVPTGRGENDWEGRGAIDGTEGHYDWIFPDGKRGRTTFTRRPDGSLAGHVKGTGIGWHYVAKRLGGDRKQPDLVGTYLLFPAEDPSGHATAYMAITAQLGAQFLVGCAIPTGEADLDWEGRGVVEGRQGHYDWAFPDGKHGRTTFTVDSKGTSWAGCAGAESTGTTSGRASRARSRCRMLKREDPPWRLVVRAVGQRNAAMSSTTVSTKIGGGVRLSLRDLSGLALTAVLRTRK